MKRRIFHLLLGGHWHLCCCSPWHARGPRALLAPPAPLVLVVLPAPPVLLALPVLQVLQVLRVLLAPPALRVPPELRADSKLVRVRNSST